MSVFTKKKMSNLMLTAECRLLAQELLARTLLLSKKNDICYHEK